MVYNIFNKWGGMMLYFLKGTYPFLDLESNSIMQKLVSKEDLETKFLMQMQMN